MTSVPEAAAPFSHIKVRTSALVFCGDHVALIRRDRADSTHYATIGGNVETRSRCAGTCVDPPIGPSLAADV